MKEVTFKFFLDGKEVEKSEIENMFANCNITVKGSDVFISSKPFNGSMRDFGEKLLEEERNRSYSTRHKSVKGETHPISQHEDFLKSEWCSEFREDRLSEAEKQYKKAQKEQIDIENRITISKIKRENKLNEEYKITSEGMKEVIENIGQKHSAEKPQISLLFKQFPKALEAVSKCSQYGHEKYKETDSDYLNFKRVEGGSKAYADAGLRHRLQEGNDIESNLPHKYHIVWNALAELELYIEEQLNKS